MFTEASKVHCSDLEKELEDSDSSSGELEDN